MTSLDAQRDELEAEVLALIERLGTGERDDAARDGLIAKLADHQAQRVEAYARFRSQRRAHPSATSLDRIPALPTDAFRFARIAGHPEACDLRRFVSSGTTQSERSTHAFRSLRLYDRAAELAARHALFPDVARMALVILAPSADEVPTSSLSYMLSRFCAWFASSHVYVVRDQTLDHELLARTLTANVADATPVALLGTSFAFVHALDALGARRFSLPTGSRIMQTGGFKGRSREIAPTEMRELLGHTFGLDDAFIVAEYGMTELSSQLYETTLREAALGLPRTPRRLWAPGWVRALPVDPETLLARTDGKAGLLRVDDAANLDSVSCIQTADVAERLADGIVVHGRAQGAIARGCSITADELLSARR